MEMLLKKQELLDLGGQLQGVKIVCQRGQCWITQSDDSRDHIMRSGGSFTIEGKGRVIITATESCRIMLVESSKARKLQAPYKSAYNLLKNCLVNSSGSAHLS
jgi:hypothetical protein